MTDFRATQVGLEAWVINPRNAVSTQVGLEVWDYFTSNAIISQAVLEVWRTPGTLSRSLVATQIGIEAWITPTFLYATQSVLEVWRTTSVGGQVTPPFFWWLE
jgi:hypothetical protein